MRVRKKPVEVEAHQVNATNIHEIAKWCGGFVKHRDDNFEPSIEIMTLEGIITAQINDWVIRGVVGEFYPCKPDIFEQTYEVIEE